MNRALLTIPAWLLVTGCFTGKEDLEGNGPYCEDTPTAITLEEVTELGFSAADLLAAAEGSFEEELYWAGVDGTTTITVDVNYAEGELNYVTSSAVYPDEGETSIAIGIECEDYVEVYVAADIATADGALDETMELALSSRDGLTTAASKSFAEGELQGSYEYTGMDPSEYDSIAYAINVAFDEEGCSGALLVQTEGCDADCDGDECTCWAGSETVAEWPVQY